MVTVGSKLIAPELSWGSHRHSLGSATSPLQPYGSRISSTGSFQSFRSQDSLPSMSGAAPLLPPRSTDAPSIQSSIHRTKSWRQKHFSGWRVGVTCCAALAAVVLLVNVSWTIWAVASFGVDDGIGTLHTGSCSVTKKMSLWLHLAILSSALL